MTVDRQSRSANGIAGFNNIDVAIGSGGNDLLVGRNIDADWTILGTDQGSITDSDGAALSFSQFRNLTGGTLGDRFRVTSSGKLTGTLLGNGVPGTIDSDHVDLAQVTVPVTARITGTDEGTIESSDPLITFSSIESVTTGQANDVFVMSPGSSLTGEIDGHTGLRDHLDYSAWSTSVSVTLLGENTSGVVNGSIHGIEDVTGGSAADTITGNLDGNRLIGLGGGDTIDAGDGDNVVIGDSAIVTQQAFVLSSIRTLSDDSGSDIITVGNGNNLILAGSGDDNVTTGDGNNVVGGDQVLVTLSGGRVVEIQSIQPADGGNDTFTLGSGNDILIAGNGADTVTDNGGNNVIIGDRGLIRLTTVQTNDGQTLISLPSIAVSEFSVGSGEDNITTGNGVDAIIGGGSGDTIVAGNPSLAESGGNYVLGDDGAISFVDGVPVTSTLSPSVMDGNDHVTTGAGRDIVYTGNRDNTVLAGSGDDDVIGGNGIDVIDGQDGNDWLVGLLGSDDIKGGKGEDVIFGGLALGTRADYDSQDDFTVPAEVLAVQDRYSTDSFIGVTDNSISEFGRPDNSASGNNDNYQFTTLITPIIVAGVSIDGTAGDGRDRLDGGDDNDVIFGGADADELQGGEGIDYLDGGAGLDIADGGDGDDIVRGGEGGDELLGGIGIDQLIGDGGDDELRGEAGNAELQAGQRLFGGPGRDRLYAYSDSTTVANVAGDQLFGDSGGDFLYGNVRVEVLVGGSGNDFISGDLYAGPDTTNKRTNADSSGANDILLGGGGEDQLFGGGGNDEIWGGAGTDYIHGQGGSDTQYGGSGIDRFVLPTINPAIDTINGHYGNEVEGDVEDDNATDILTIDGTTRDDTILIGRQADQSDDQATVRYNNVPISVNMLENGNLLVEQFRIAGLAGDDTIGFYTDLAVQSGAIAEVAGLNTIDLSALSDRSNDFVGVFDGNSGNDILIGSDGRDRLDGGIGSDTVFGFGGSDRLWGDGGGGLSSDTDTLFAGQGDDDLIGGQGKNNLYAWTFDPTRTVTQLGFSDGQTVVAGQIMTASNLTPVNGQLLLDAVFDLAIDGGQETRVFLQRESTTTPPNQSRSDLAADLQAAIDAAGISGVTVGVIDGGSDDGKLTLSHASGGLTISRPGFGVYVDAMGGLTVDDFDLNDNGLLDSDELSPMGPYRLAYDQEVTGLNRLLGSQRNDNLYGGTTLDFMYGNGGDDTLFRADGTTFESADEGVAGDEWKDYARESDQVWYVGGSNASDQINIDFVTEPGLLSDHHLITRLTENNGNFSFSAQVKLDFTATNGAGNAVWSANDLQFSLDDLNAANDETRGDELSAIATSQIVESDLLASILPPEADFLVILVDALDGNDRITVGPTVQKTVWIDAGAGDDVVDIRSGNAILVDRAESSIGTSGLASRNDIPEQAFELFADSDGVAKTFGGTAVEDDLVTFTGLSIDNPEDVDWYQFQPVSETIASTETAFAPGSPAAGWQFLWNPPSGWDAAGNSGDGSTGPVGDPANYEPLIYSPVGNSYTVDGDNDNANNLPGGFLRIAPNFQHPGSGSNSLDGVGNTVDRSVIWAYTIQEDGRYSIPEGAVTRNGEFGNGHRVIVHVDSETPLLDAALPGATAGDVSPFSLDLGSLNAGQTVYVVISPNGNGGDDSFKLDFNIAKTSNVELKSGSPIDELGLAIFPVGSDTTDETNQINSASFQTSGDQSSISIAGLDTQQKYWLRVDSPNVVPTLYDLRFNLDGASLETLTSEQLAEKDLSVKMSLREDVIRRDVILGGAGNDILRGGAGEDWIFGNDGNDVLVGGADRNASDLLFGGPGDDTFQIITDDLPLLGNQAATNFDPATKTFIPTYSEQLIGGEGTDRILYLGGDTDRRGMDVPDYVSMRYNTGLHRYEFTSLVWDIGLQEYRYDDVNDDGDQDAGEDFVQKFTFFQTRGDIESFTIDTGAGDDVVRLDSEFQFLPLTGDPFTTDTTNAGLYEEWGLDRGDAEQGADLPITILGGAGDDFLFGSPSNDTIVGGLGDDLIVGGLGNDNLDGDGGEDTIFGNQLDVSVAADPYPYFPPKPQFFEFFNFDPELHQPILATPFSAQFVETRTGIDLNAGVPAGAIVHYSFNDPTDLGNDNSGVGNDAGLLTGITTVAAGAFGGAVAFTDQSSRILVGASGVDAGSEWTASAWFKNAIDSGDWNTLFRDQSNATNVGVRAGGSNLGVWNSGFGDSGYDVDLVDLSDEWHQLTAVGSGGETKLFIDGQLVGVSDRQAGSVFSVLGNHESASEQFAEQLDEVYIYDRALSDSEVQRLYDNVDIPIGSIDDVGFGLQGSENDRINSLDSYGDINGDGFEDFITRGTSKSYVLLGPVELTDMEDIETFAEVVIDHETLGRPVEGIGDINADGILDFAFLTSDADNMTVRVLYGDSVVTQRNWNADYWSAAAEKRTIVLPHNFLGTADSISDIHLEMVSFFEEETSGVLHSDILISAGSTNGTFQNADDSYLTGLLFSGKQLDLEPDGEFGIENRSGEIFHTNASSDASTKVVRDITSEGSIHLLTTGSSAVMNARADQSGAATGVQVPSQAIPGITSKFQITLAGEDPLALDITPSVNILGSVRFAEIQSQIRDAIEANPALNGRIIVQDSPNKIVLNTFERGNNAPSITLSETVTSQPLGFDEFSNVVFPNGTNRFVVSSHPFDLGLLSTNLVSTFDVDVYGGRTVTVDFRNATNKQDIANQIFDQTNVDNEGIPRHDNRTCKDSGVDPCVEVSFTTDNRIILARGDFLELSGFESVSTTPLIGGFYAQYGGSSSTLTTNTLLRRSDYPGESESVQFIVDNQSNSSFTPSSTFVIGDMNGDQISEFAKRSIDRLDIYFGSNSFETSLPTVPDLTVMALDGKMPQSSVVGDFDLDGFADLAIQSKNGTEGFDVTIFFDINNHIQENGNTLHASEANTEFRSSELIEDLAGQLSSFDLDSDGTDDLIFGTADSDNNVDGALVVQGGRLSVAYGTESFETVELPKTFDDLENFNVSGSGSFVVDRGTGRTEVFDEGDVPFTTDPASNGRWFQFTTLGDGIEGNLIKFGGDVRADLVDSNGRVLESGQSVLDLRTLISGTYYLRVESIPGIQDWAFSRDSSIHGWEIINGNVPNSGTLGLTAADSSDDFAASAGHANFLATSPTIRFSDVTVDETNLLSLTFGGGDVNGAAGAQTLPTTTLYESRSDVISYNGGDTNEDGHIALGFYNVETGRYDGFAYSEEAIFANNFVTIEFSKSDLRAIGVNATSGAYRLDYFDTDSGSQGWQILNRVVVDASVAQEFTIEFDAPIRGQDQIIETDASPDRDVIRGGAGDDVLVGNHELDRIFGGSGSDTFTAEAVEVRDRDLADATLVAVPTPQQIAENALRELDPVAISVDAVLSPSDMALNAAIATQLGYPVANSATTGLPTTQRDIRVSELNQLVSLTANASEIDDTAISRIAEFENLRFLDLRGTSINPLLESNQVTLASLTDLETLYLPIEGLAEDTNLIGNEGDQIDVTRTRTSIDFDGTSSVLTSNNSIQSLPIGDSSYTLAAWIKPDDMSNLGGIIGWGDYAASGSTNALRLSSNGIRNVWTNGGFQVVTGDLTTQWHHVAATYDGTTARIYLDGVLQGAQTPSVEINVGSTSNFEIGHYDPGTDRFFDGKISDAGVWNRALSPAEIETAVDSSLKHITDGQVAFWEFNEGSGSNVQSSGQTPVIALVGSNLAWAADTDTVSQTLADNGVVSVVVENVAVPIFVSNVDPKITVPSVLGGITEGQTIAIGPNVGTSDHTRGLSIDGSPLGNLVVTDSGSEDVPDLVVAVSVTDPSGQTTSLIQGSAKFYDDALEISNKALNGVTNLTTTFWLKTTKQTEQTIVSGINADSASEFSVSLIDNTSIRLIANGQTIDWTGLPDTSDGAFHHFAISRNLELNVAQLYVDGVLQDEKALTNQSRLRVDSGGLLLGQSQSYLGEDSGRFNLENSFVGSLDDFTIWDRVLTKDEFDSVLAGKVDSADANLRLHLSFDEGAGDQVADRGPLGLDAKLEFDPDRLAFNDSFVELPHSVLDGADDLTVAFTFTTTSSGNQTIISGATSDNADNFSVSLIGSNTIRLRVLGMEAEWTTTFNDGYPQVVAITRSADHTYTLFKADLGTAYQLFPSGSRTLNTPGTISVDPGGLFLGQDQDSVGGGFDSSESFNGTLTDLVIWDRSVGSFEIDNALGFGNLDLDDSSLRLFYDFEDGKSLPQDQSTYLHHAIASTAAHATILNPDSPVLSSDSPFETPSLTVVDNGTYTLTVTASDGDGGFDESVTEFVVGNVAPEIGGFVNFHPSSSLAIGERVGFDAEDVTDAGVLDKQSYLWEVTSNNGETFLSGDKDQFDFTPSYSGRYTISLTVTDNDGDASVPYTQTFDVAPTAEVSSPLGAVEHTVDFSDSWLIADQQTLGSAEDYTLAISLRLAEVENQRLFSTLDAELIAVIRDANTIGFVSQGVDVQWSDLPDLDDGDFHHFTFLRDMANGKLELFLDGVSYGERTVSGQSALNGAALVVGTPFTEPSGTVFGDLS
ncbi:MAG: LamG-like jellyroll fold domain-containing protein, partial [Rubripirellula sp.]